MIHTVGFFFSFFFFFLAEPQNFIESASLFPADCPLLTTVVSRQFAKPHRSSTIFTVGSRPSQAVCVAAPQWPPLRSGGRRVGRVGRWMRYDGKMTNLTCLSVSLSLCLLTPMSSALSASDQFNVARPRPVHP
ncbi:hypothetical protein F5Y11DRAFT_323028 [Daldinia sp. FL1419]|nr:hypothetical protein F5Y11DRAFT_323028 [Daldinia sp. FL1419]